MCNKAVDNSAYALKFAPDWYKTQEMCIKAIDNYPSTMLFVPACYKTKEMCNKAINTFSLDSVLDRYMSQ